MDSEIFRLLKGLCSEDLSSFSVLMNFHGLQLVNEGNINNRHDPTPTIWIIEIFHRFYGPSFELGLLQIYCSKHYSQSFFSFLW